MNGKLSLSSGSRTHISVAAYLGVLILSIFGAWYSLTQVWDKHATVTAAAEMLAQLESRKDAAIDDARSRGYLPPGEPLLAGRTLNVAGAALLQRVAGAVNRFGGSVLSSQVDLQRADNRDGWIGLVISLEIDQEAAQKLLYDLESGMPFIYVDQLMLQAAQPPGKNERLKVFLAVSARWKGGQ